MPDLSLAGCVQAHTLLLLFHAPLEFPPFFG